MGLIRKFTAASPHLKIALVVAPLLAVGGWIAADLLFPASGPSETRQTDEPLRLNGECRLPGGVCELLHREIAVNLGAEPLAGGAARILLRATVPLKGALVARNDEAPVAMTPRGDATRWQARLDAPLAPGDRLRLAVVTESGRRYWAEIPAAP